MQPDERLENGIQNVYILGEDEGLILKANEEFIDKESETVHRKPGDRWMIRGPMEYVPPVQVDVISKRKAIPLDENEGIYVRDVKSGKVDIASVTLCYVQLLNLNHVSNCICNCILFI